MIKYDGIVAQKELSFDYGDMIKILKIKVGIYLTIFIIGCLK